MKEVLRVDRAKEEQISQIIKLVRTSLEETYLIPSIYRGDGIEKYLKSEFHNHKTPYSFFVVSIDDQIVGYCELKCFYPKIFLNMITIDKSYKDKGIGRFLMDYIASFSKSNNYESILLDVFKSNKVANDWYQRKGFKELSSKNFLKSSSYSYNIDIPFQIINYPQVQLEKEYYGFSIIKVFKSDQVYEYGIINKTLIARNEYSSTVAEIGFNLLQTLYLKDLYFYSSEPICREDKLEIIDSISRKELKL